MQNKRIGLSEVFWQRVQRFPPILMRLLAIDEHRKPIATTALAEETGLSPAMIEAISQSTDWSQIPLETFRLFSRSCRTDLMNRKETKRAVSYLNGKTVAGRRIPPTFHYLKLNPLWESYYKPMLKRYEASLLQRGRTGAQAGG